MNKIIYTKHAEDKLKTKESKKFTITKRKIENVIKQSSDQVLLPLGVIRTIGLLDKSHSLCVVFKHEHDIIKVITYFPAEKGRYENQILS